MFAQIVYRQAQQKKSVSDRQSKEEGKGKWERRSIEHSIVFR